LSTGRYCGDACLPEIYFSLFPGSGIMHVQSKSRKEALMNAFNGPVSAYRRYWLPELAALLAFAVAAIILFAVSDLDIAAMRLFYHPEHGEPWPDADKPVWSLFYRSAPWVTASLAIAGAALLVMGMLREKSRRFRQYGLFILLCVVLGPGLVINVVLKDHWGRPRPRQIVEFGGRYEYVQPLVPSGSRGKSFPCGHCSVGYLYAAGWWLWRRRYPRRAALSLATGLTLGTLLGLGRMAAGAHFLSDAVWSALLAYAVAHCLYYYVIRVPASEDSRPTVYPLIAGNPRLRAAAIAAVVFLGLGIVIGGVLASPHDKDLTARVRLADFPAAPETLEVTVDRLDVELRLVAEPRGEIECAGAVHGFGLPTNEIDTVWEFEQLPRPALRYRIVMKGVFTDIDGVVRLRIPAEDLRAVIVRVRRGDISVIDETGLSAEGRLPALDLHTADGGVRRPSTNGVR
jgi:membrane-associated PAP2 superfamily phosphatase